MSFSLREHLQEELGLLYHFTVSAWKQERFKEALADFVKGNWYKPGQTALYMQIPHLQSIRNRSEVVFPVGTAAIQPKF